MLKLAIIVGVAGITILCGFMTFKFRSNLGGKSSSSSLQSNGGVGGLSIVNDIKEIFGLPPIRIIGSSNSFRFDNPSSTGNSGGSSSGAGGGYYLPPKSFKTDLNSNEIKNDTNGNDATTPYLRIFILSSTSATTLPTSSSTTKPQPPSSIKEETKFKTTTMETSYLPPDSTFQLNLTGGGAQLQPPKQASSGQGESRSGMNETSTEVPVPTESTITIQTQSPNTSLRPPPTTSASFSTELAQVASSTTSTFSVNNTEENSIDVRIEENIILSSRNASEDSAEAVVNQNISSSTVTATTTTEPSNRLYLPPNKEYLPPPPRQY